MNVWKSIQFSGRTWLAISAGLLWALAFPNWNLAITAWIAPGLLFLTGSGASIRQCLRLGWVAGFAHNLVALYWLIHIPFFPGNLLGWILLSAYCALFPMIWVWFCWFVAPFERESTPEPAVGSPGGFGPIKLRSQTWNALHRLLDSPWPARHIWILVCAIGWVALEFTRGWFLSGFPWNFLGASQYRAIPLIQMAEWTGVHGISLVIAWVSLSLALGALAVITRPHRRFAWKNECAIQILVLLVIMAKGMNMSTRPAPEAGGRSTIKVALVQPSIPQDLIFDPAEDENRFEQLMELSRMALAGDPDLLIWPEASLPALEADAYERLLNLIREHDAWFLFGADDRAPASDRPDGTGFVYFNAAFLIDPDGQYQSTYRKQRLVIFGEYVPLQNVIPFLGWFTPVEGGFGRGEGPVKMSIPEVNAEFSVNICFEDNFADLIRNHTAPDTDFLVNLTNNGWFGESAAQWQHAVNAVFRCVENRIPLVRCTNNGLTCWIDRHGRMHSVSFDEGGDIYQAGIKFAEIPLLPDGEERTPTIYNQKGDWLGWSATWISLLWLARSAWGRKDPER